MQELNKMYGTLPNVHKKHEQKAFMCNYIHL